jgi:hypothetical protein
MAWIGTMPGSTDLAPGQAARRKPTDDGWEGYHMVTAEEMAEKADAGSLSDVATSGSYNDLSDKPTIPTVTPQVNADWNATSGVEEILNKPELSEVATSGDYSDLSGAPELSDVALSGDYSDLTNTPTIPSAQVNADWESTSGVSEILNKPTLSTVATTGSYDDLSDKPTIPTPTPQVNSDWNATSGVSQILNKPTIPTVRREEVYSGTTGSDGRYTVVYSTPYSQTPFVQPMVNVDSSYRLLTRVVSSDANGFTVEVAQRNASLLTLLGLDVLTAGVTAQNNVSVMVKVTAR